MKINKLFNHKLPFKVIKKPENLPEVSGVSYNSKDTKENYVFVAVKGLTKDGHDYVISAQENKASCIVCEKEIKGVNIPQIVVSDSRRALSFISAWFYGFPSKDVNIIGVTGTNGKTTICSIIETILEKSGKRPGVIGTIDTHYKKTSGEKTSMANANTTPESKDLQEILFEMNNNGVTDIIMEVSSHAAFLKRVDDVYFNTIVFSNLTQDHLDFHKSMEEYARVKSEFVVKNALGFETHPPCSVVVNSDDNTGKKIISEIKDSKADFLSFSTHKKTGLSASDIKASIDETKFSLNFNNNEYKIKSHLKGRHNIENILAAIGACIFSGVKPEECFELAQEALPVSGRLDQVLNNKRPNIFVDYAHTPDALENVLNALKPLCEGRLICVFGCGGDRDSKKRPLMGQMSGNIADISIITSDNPRTEDPEKIIEDIEPGISELAKKKDFSSAICAESNIYMIEKDRKKAIEKGVEILGPKDCMVIAGKGHETYQILGTTKIHFDDKEEVLRSVEKIYG